jgi:hypothetical protein
MTLPLTEALEELIALGVDGPALVAAIRRLEAVTYTQRIESLEDAVRVATAREDAALAERNARKAKDRDRKKPKAVPSTEFHGIPGNAEEVHGTSVEAPPSRPSSPQTPLQPTHPPVECVSTRTRGGDDFDRFWQAYPRKTAKDVARKAFPGALRRASVDTMIAALERQREWDQWRRGIVPHPATWLNQSRWNDEAPEIQEPRKAHDRTHPDQRQAAREDGLRAHHAGAMAALNRRLGSVG